MATSAEAPPTVEIFSEKFKEGLNVADPVEHINLLNSAGCIYKPTPLSSIAEFQFENISLIDKLVFTGAIDVHVEIFLANVFKPGFKLFTYKEHIVGEDITVDLKDVIGTHIIVKKEVVTDPMKIKLLKVIGRDCMKTDGFSKGNGVELLKGKLADKEQYKNHHITKENIGNYRLGNLIYISEDCLDYSLATLEHLFILRAICLRNNKRLVLPVKAPTWVFDVLVKDPELFFTIDNELIENQTFELISEANAELKIAPSHILRIYNNISYNSLVTERFIETYHMILNRRFSIDSKFIDEIAQLYKKFFTIDSEEKDDTKKEYKTTYGIYYKGTNSLGKHYDYELVEKYMRNVIENSYDDRSTIRMYIGSDEAPFIKHMKDKFGDIVICIEDLFRYDINTSGKTFESIGDTKEINTEMIKQNISAKEKEDKDVDEKSKQIKLTILDLFMLSRCKNVFVSHGRESELIQVFREKPFDRVLYFKKELIKA